MSTVHNSVKIDSYTIDQKRAEYLINKSNSVVQNPSKKGSIQVVLTQSEKDELEYIQVAKNFGAESEYTKKFQIILNAAPCDVLKAELVDQLNAE